MKSSESSMSVAISKHEREGLSGVSTTSDSKRPCSHPETWAGHEKHRIEREDEREREHERLERLGETDSISNAAAATSADSAGGL